MSTALKYLLLCSLPFLARQVQMACKRSGWSVIETMQICMFECERDVSHTYGMTVTGQAVGFFFLKHLRCWLEFPNCYLFEKAHKRTPFTVTASLKVFQCCFFSLLNCFLSVQCIFIAFAATAGLQIYPHFYLRIPKNIFFCILKTRLAFGDREMILPRKGHWAAWEQFSLSCHRVLSLRGTFLIFFYYTYAIWQKKEGLAN